MTSDVFIVPVMIRNTKLTALVAAVMILGVLVFNPATAAGANPQPVLSKKQAAEKRAEKRARRFGQKLQTLTQLKKAFTQIKKRAHQLNWCSPKRCPFGWFELKA